MRIDIIVVAYGLADDLLKLFEAANAPNIMWHLFLHSRIPHVVTACEWIVATYPNLYYYAYMVNRGLAKSWNEGLHAAYRDGADVAMIANDDVLPAPGDVQRLADAALEHRDCFHIVGNMLDQRSGQIVDSQFGLCSINPIALEAIGYFDENIFPIYWEDIDYIRRARLAGLQEFKVEDTNIVHAGSKTSASAPGMVDYLSTFFNLNRAYYFRKWGGSEIGLELYPIPFNDARLGLHIPYEQRETPYPGYDRNDQNLVKG